MGSWGNLASLSGLGPEDPGSNPGGLIRNDFVREKHKQKNSKKVETQKLENQSSEQVYRLIPDGE